MPEHIFNYPAMLNNPALLIMDEPTSAMDVIVEAAVLDLVAFVIEIDDEQLAEVTNHLDFPSRKICDGNQVSFFMLKSTSFSQ